MARQQWGTVDYIKPGFLLARVVLKVMMLSVTHRFATVHPISIWELAIDIEMDPHYSINFQCYMPHQLSVVHFEQQSCVWNTYVKIRHCWFLKLFPVLLRNHPNRHIMYNTPCVTSKRWLRKAKRTALNVIKHLSKLTEGETVKASHNLSYVCHTKFPLLTLMYSWLLVMFLKEWITMAPRRKL